jgi:hypothetical protein
MANGRGGVGGVVVAVLAGVGDEREGGQGGRFPLFARWMQKPSK